MISSFDASYDEKYPMQLISLLYVSESALSSTTERQSVDDIVATANRRNPAMNVTGALLFTGSHFAQILEGEKEIVEVLLSEIAADSRHRNIRVVDQHPLHHRKFLEWSMAYFGPSIFISRHVNSLLQSPVQTSNQGEGEWLSALLREFIATSK